MIQLKQNTKVHYLTWPQTLDHPYKILTICVSGSKKKEIIY